MVKNIITKIIGKEKRTSSSVLNKSLNLKHLKHEIKEGILHEELETPEYERTEEKNKYHRG